MTPPTITVVGSVNLDMVARAPRLPVPGETVTDAQLDFYPGGKGANQALAARRLGAQVALCAAVGKDTLAGQALTLLREDGVDLSACIAVDAVSTGVALIAVASDTAENQIVVAPGANRRLLPELLAVPTSQAVICQLEVPLETLTWLARCYTGFLCINLAPPMAVPDELLRRADLLVLNETEAAVTGSAIELCQGLVALTYGARGAELQRGGATIAAAEPPVVEPVDTTGAGDTFTAALVLALMEGLDHEAALRFACTAGALATTREGAQPSFPRREEVGRLLGAGV